MQYLMRVQGGISDSEGGVFHRPGGSVASWEQPVQGRVGVGARVATLCGEAPGALGEGGCALEFCMENLIGHEMLVGSVL